MIGQPAGRLVTHQRQALAPLDGQVQLSQRLPTRSLRPQHPLVVNMPQPDRHHRELIRPRPNPPVLRRPLHHSTLCRAVRVLLSPPRSELQLPAPVEVTAAGTSCSSPLPQAGASCTHLQFRFRLHRPGRRSAEFGESCIAADTADVFEHIQPTLLLATTAATAAAVVVAGYAAARERLEEEQGVLRHSELGRQHPVQVKKSHPVDLSCKNKRANAAAAVAPKH